MLSKRMAVLRIVKLVTALKRFEQTPQARAIRHDIPMPEWVRRGGRLAEDTLRVEPCEQREDETSPVYLPFFNP